MRPGPEDLENQSEYRQILKLPFEDLASFVLEQLRRKDSLIIFFWSLCTVFIATAAIIRINMAGHFPLSSFLVHTFSGLVLFPVASVVLHELMHIIPFWLAGARKIRIGMDLRQFIFFVTAHRHVVNRNEFFIIALAPFVLITIALLVCVLVLPGLWKWSLSLFLFVHTTMCAGDIALVNYFLLHKGRNIYTWDDADSKTAYFYERI